MKYFYIITFDTQILEIGYTEEKLNACMNAWKNGELLVLKELGAGIHASSISKILSEDLYDSYTLAVKPKLYIKDGTWYDGAERKMIRREKWKQAEIENRANLPHPYDGKAMSLDEKKKMFEEVRPAMQALAKKMKML